MQEVIRTGEQLFGLGAGKGWVHCGIFVSGLRTPFGQEKCLDPYFEFEAEDDLENQRNQGGTESRIQCPTTHKFLEIALIVAGLIKAV